MCSWGLGVGLLLPVLSKSTLSLRPSLSSGMPVSLTFIFTEPTISLCSTCPFLLTWTQPHRGQGGRLQHHACTSGHWCGGTRREGPEPHQKVDRLNDVEKHFVLAVADPLLPPRHCVSDSCRDVGHGLQLVALLSDEPGQPGQASRDRHVRLERERLTLSGSCPLWSEGNQSPSAHPAAHRAAQSYL